VFLVIEHVESVQKKICIIGSGIGGSSTAYFAHELVPDAEIIVLERANRIGGRMHAFEYRGKMIEAGGTIVHAENKYMIALAKQLGLTVQRPGSLIEGGHNMGIYNGETFIYQSSSYNWISIVKMLWRYGRSNLMNMQNYIQKCIQKFNRIYGKQDAGMCFERPEDLWSELGRHSL